MSFAALGLMYVKPPTGNVSCPKKEERKTSGFYNINEFTRTCAKAHVTNYLFLSSLLTFLI